MTNSPCWLMKFDEGWPPLEGGSGELFWRRGRCGSGGRRNGKRRHGLAFAHDGDAVDDDGSEGLVVRVAFNAGDGGYDEGSVRIAEAEDGVFAIELRDGGVGDEELAAVGACPGGARAGVGHGADARWGEGG